MATIRKKGKSAAARRNAKMLNITLKVTLVSGLLFLGSSLFLRSYNNRLSTEAQDISSKIAVLETQNDAVRIDIQTLGNYNRVESITSEEGMTMNPNNIITISAGNSAEGEQDASRFPPELPKQCERGSVQTVGHFVDSEAFKHCECVASGS